jgi:hypothetical protein
MGNNVVTRFPNGVTNSAQDAIFGDLITTDSTKLHTYWNDFDTYTAGDWVVTAVGAGSQALAAGDGGWLLLTNAAADNDMIGMQKTPAAFTLSTTKKAFFKTRFKTSDATQSDIAVGLQIVDTTPLDVTDGVYFLKADGAATADIICRKDATTGSTSASAVATLVSDTFIELAWYYDGNGTLQYAVDGTVIGSLSVASYFPDSILTVSFAIQNGEGVAKTLTMDFIYAAIER